MTYTKFFLHLIVISTCIACGSADVSFNTTATPEFVTATLPSTPTLAILTTSTTLPNNVSNTESAPIVQLPPVEGTTTAQVNVRAETSTASDSLGIVAAFSKIQVLGKESSGNWYHVRYAESTGWVRAEFVQVDASAEVAVVAIESNNPVGGSGVVTSGINVRNGAGTEYESIGVLIKGDVIWVTGKDATNSWLQIDFKNGVGWVSADFLQVATIASLPVIGTTSNIEPTLAVVNTNEAPLPPALLAVQDYDSMQMPIANILLNSKKSFQIVGEVSSPQGDVEDWIAFSSSTAKIVIKLSCSAVGLQVELWQADVVTEIYSAPCDESMVIHIESNKNYVFRIFQSGTSYIRYFLKVQAVN